MKFINERAKGYRLLSGRGLELGAFEHPAALPSSCTVRYCDRFTMDEAQILFPEVDCSQLVEPDHLLDLDRDGLVQFPSGTEDFIIFNHVVEHLVNPIRVLEEIFRVLRPGGMCAIAAPDKNYTFDRARPLSEFAALREAYENNAEEVSEVAYMDIITYIHKDLIGEPAEVLRHHLLQYRARKEHLHVWTSESFREFLDASFSYLGIRVRLLYEVIASVNEFEYFAVWVKQ